MVAHGVRLAGYDVGGLHVDEARALVARRLLPRLQRPVIVRYGSSTFRLSPEAAGLRADVASAADRALRRSREGGFFQRVVRDVRGDDLRARVPVRVTYAPAAVDAFAERIAKQVDRPAASARVIPSPTSLRTVRSHDGIRVQTDVLEQQLRAELLRPWTARKLKLPTEPVHPAVSTPQLAARYPAYIIVNRGAFELRLFRNLKPYKSYRIAVGRIGLETPAGLYHVQDKQIDPSWHVPKSPWAGSLAGRVIPPGPDDPLKARWLGIYNGAGIHGTDNIGSLGSAASHGCIRMSIPDVIELYGLVPLGAPVFIV